MSLTDELLSQLQGAPLQQVSQQLGLDSRQAAGAVSAALPLLLGALGNNAARPQGAEALFGALQDNHSGLDIGGVLGAVLGGGSSPATNGAGILGHIFGGNQGRAEAGLAQATGLGGERAGQLLRILAPVVMAYLAQRLSAADQVDAGGLGRLLGEERQQVVQQGGVAGGLLGSLLDQDGDGQLGVSDLIRLGSGLLGSGKR
ncbi:DUF937 domain-containing protein [Stenotrophomonas acidaminiphila]|uniref:DUF937 domain-containing protein n=1 Tax=Stenotrophomonas TaxID=40323 RepID=UPI001355D171|nr:MULTISPECIES: DUF937 domain-containing protein [Stenotrophomonas]MCH1907489.1 DUF937 domain-containing protein [Stenotrophomonas sp. Y6]MTI75617.1 DUF937 domain-containing protein [Stenotrophomonas sp.]NCT87219.1 DUF937 domain-containing protein [Stenotrophomonas acidaminiphila]